MTEQEQLTKILNLLDKLDTDIRETNKHLEKEAKNTKKQFEKWDERYFNLVKDQENTARAIIIAAASVVVLSPVLGMVGDLVKHFLMN